MKKIVIIGSGIVGICTGIELINRGFSVTLIDPNEPGSQTSYGNAGVLTDSSLMIINNPHLFRSCSLNSGMTDFDYFCFRTHGKKREIYSDYAKLGHEKLKRIILKVNV